MIENINVPLKWNETYELPYEGLYFVAIRYPTGFGSYMFANWNGETWDLNFNAGIVGWVTTDELINSINAGWPEGDPDDKYVDPIP